MAPLKQEIKSAHLAVMQSNDYGERNKMSHNTKENSASDDRERS